MLYVHLLTKLPKQARAKGMCLMRLITLTTSFNTLVNSSNIFRLSSICLWMAQCIDLLSGTTSIVQVIKPDSRPVMAAARVCICQHKRSIYVVLIYNHPVTWTFLFLWCWSSKIVHITTSHAHPPDKNVAHKQVALPSWRYL